MESGYDKEIRKEMLDSFDKTFEDIRIRFIKNMDDARDEVEEYAKENLCDECKNFGVEGIIHVDDPASVTGNINFSEVLCLLKEGAVAYRTGWNGCDMTVEVQYPDKNSKMGLPYFYMTLPDTTKVPWIPSITDLFENDWVAVETGCDE